MTTPSLDQRAEALWKWLLRLAGLAAFVYVLIAKDGDVPLGVFVLIGGLIGLPNVISAQQLLNRKDEP
jgi:hypothetical protein